MTGNQDKAARAAAWAGDLTEVLMPTIDRSVAVVTVKTLERGDVAGAERLARAVGVIARSAKAVVALATSPRSPGGRQPEEDEMDHRDDSPETLQRLRAELEARLGVLDALLEQKGLVVEPGCWPTARPDGDALRTA